MKHFMFIFVMYLCSLGAFADNDVGKYEGKTMDMPVVTDVSVYCPLYVYEFISYDDCTMCTVVEFQNLVPSHKSYPIPHFMLYDVRKIPTTATAIEKLNATSYKTIIKYVNALSDEDDEPMFANLVVE